MGVRVQVRHITDDLEQEIRQEIEVLEKKLRGDGMDDRPFQCNMIHQRVTTLRWVLERSREELRG